jgi:hypothetical protein
MSTANLYLPDRYDEFVGRLAVGFTPIDGATLQSTARGVQMQLEDVPRPVRLVTKALDPCLYDAGFPTVPRHASSRFAVSYPTARPDTVTVRMFDCRRWFVPRRFRVEILTRDQVVIHERAGATPTAGAVRPLPMPPARTWTRRPVLFPGAAYQTASGSTALRGLVVRDRRPLRWARVDGRDPQTGALLGRAHGDDRGEFLLVIGSVGVPSNVTRLVDPVRVRIEVFGPRIAPVQGPTDAADPLWDLPVEVTPGPGDPDPVSSGDVLPDAYVPTATANPVVELEVGQVTSRTEPPFEFGV